MNNSDDQVVYSCDFRSSDGSRFFGYQGVVFPEDPPRIAIVNGMAFERALQSGNFLVYLQVSIFDLSSQMSLSGVN
ncbi:hypothetical protein QUB75_27145 [Microcoleus sp. K1-B6]|uniref:hypothetical protein n=1 Tax=unclassified Microcoleus TaxID=2642155 RepID=UPI002FD12D8C